MVTINTTDDLLRLLDENPEFREAVRNMIMTRELIALPAVFASFASEMRKFQSEMTDFQSETHSFQSEMREFQSETKDFQSEMREFQSETKDFQSEMREFQSETKDFQSEMREFQSEVRTELKTHSNDIAELKDMAQTHSNDIAELKDMAQTHSNDIAELKDMARTHSNDIGVLKGIGLETRLADKGLAQIASAFSMRRMRVVRLAEHNRASERFNEAIWAAADVGLIDNSEYKRLLDTDLIVQGTVDGRKNAFCATEASYTPEADDIDKVSESANILRKVFTDAEVYAALYCMVTSAGIEAESRRKGVTLLPGQLP